MENRRLIPYALRADRMFVNFSDTIGASQARGAGLPDLAGATLKGTKSCLPGIAPGYSVITQSTGPVGTTHKERAEVARTVAEPADDLQR